MSRLSKGIESPFEFRPGDPVTWLYETNRGWGYRFRVSAFVVRVTPKRVGIAVSMKDGSWVPRWVTRERLEHRNA